MKPDFSKISYKDGINSANTKVNNNSESSWLTAEQIPVKPVYNVQDLDNMEHLDYAAGLPPFLRGPYSTIG